MKYPKLHEDGQPRTFGYRSVLKLVRDGVYGPPPVQGIFH